MDGRGSGGWVGTRIKCVSVSVLAKLVFVSIMYVSETFGRPTRIGSTEAAKELLDGVPSVRNIGQGVPGHR